MKRSSEVMMHRVGDQDLLVPLGSKVIELNGFLVLNATGCCVWELLAEDRSVDELAVIVADRFDVEHDRAERDVQAFVDELARLGLLA